MIQADELTIDELINYGINYSNMIPININDLKKLFDKKSSRKEFSEAILALQGELIEKFKLPKTAVESFIDSGYVFTLESSSVKKQLYFDYFSLMQTILTYFLGLNHSDEVNKIILAHSIEEVKELSYLKLRELRKENINCEKEKTQMNFYDNHPIICNDVAAELQKENNHSVIEMNKRIQQRITDVIVNNKYLTKFCQTAVFDESLLEDINKEKFIFYLAASTLYNCKFSKEIDNSIYYSINYYLNKIEEGMPNMMISLHGESYSFLNFSRDLQEYIKVHPEISMKKFKDNIFSDCTPEEVKEYLEEFHSETLNNFEVIDPDAVYLPYGKDTDVKRERKQIEKSERKSDEISLLTLQKRKFFHENKEQIYKALLGKNKFDGYVAHVFKNGYVIFEKYDFKNNMISNKAGAAYIMTINNFNEFSKKSIPEIRDYVKQNPNGDISYRCHRGNWMEVLQEKICEDTGISLSQIDRVLLKNVHN